MGTFMELLGLFLILMLPFIYESSHTFRYYFKFLLYYGLVTLTAFVLIPVYLLHPWDVRNFVISSICCGRSISALLGLKWEIRGKQHLSKDEACIIVANHQSSLDVLGMFNLWPTMGKCTAVAKRELFFIWPFGLAAWLSGIIYINRQSTQQARESLQIVSKIKSQNIKVWVFPEGTRRNTGELHAFKKGAFHMAVDEQLPILPVVFSSYCSFLNDKMKIFNGARIIINTLPPISTKGLTKDDIPELMDRVHQQMAEVYKQSSLEVLFLQNNKPVKPMKSKLYGVNTSVLQGKPLKSASKSSQVIENAETKGLLTETAVTPPQRTTITKQC